MATNPEVRTYLRRLRAKRRLEGPRLDMRPRVVAPTALQKIFKQRYQKRSTYYFTTGRQLPEKSIIAKDDKKPFWTPPPEHLASYISYRKQKASETRQEEKSLPVDKKPTARSRLAEGLLHRLHIPDDPAPTKKAIIDVDPEFFTIVEGRPNRDRESVREYLEHIRELARVKLKIGYNEDECILVDEQFRRENKRLQTILSQHAQYLSVFEQFLADDHASSMELIMASEAASRKSISKEAEVKSWIRTLGMARTQVYLLEERWHSVCMFQRFLYLVSPMAWRREFDYINGIAGQSDIITKTELDPSYVGTEVDQPDSGKTGTSLASLSGIGGDFMSTRLTESSGQTSGSMYRATSLQEIVNAFVEETQAGRKPELYFTEPEQLLKVFRSLAAQSLASLLHIEQLRVPLGALLEGVKKARERVAQELQVLEEQVSDLDKEIAWEENRVRELKRNADSVVGAIYEDIMAGDSNVLGIHVWVEDVYERLIAPNDTHLTSYQMMCAIERVVASELLALDYLDKEQVKKARSAVYLEERREKKAANDAQKKLQQMEQLVYRMERVLEPPPPRGRRLIVFRSRPPEPKPPPPPPPQELSEEEQDRIAFFTEVKSADRLRKYFAPVSALIEEIGQK